MGTDDTADIGLDQPDDHLQNGIVAARQQRTDDGGHLASNAQRWRALRAIPAGGDAARHDDAIDVIFLEKCLEASEIADAESGVVKAVPS